MKQFDKQQNKTRAGVRRKQQATEISELSADVKKKTMKTMTGLNLHTISSSRIKTQDFIDRYVRGAADWRK